MAISDKISATTRLDGGYYEEKQEETPATGGDNLQDALAEVDKTYDGMIDQADSFYQEQIEASKQWAQTQAGLQQEQTDFTIEQIEQQKQQAHQDYLKEQSGAYVDWQKQSGQYGVNAEAMAAQGMGGTGYSESAQVSMYNTYQVRVAMAREAFARATLNYNNAIKEARLQNNAALAEIALQAYQQQLELSLHGFQYKNQLVLEKADRKAAVENEHFDRWLQVLNQLNAKEEEEEQKGAFITRDGDVSEEDGNSSAKAQALKDIARGGVSNYRDAVDILNRCGIDPAKIGTPLMDSDEWGEAKRAGTLGSEFDGISSYREYLYCYCTWAVSNFS